jgi:exoribonuclease R
VALTKSRGIATVAPPLKDETKGEKEKADAKIAERNCNDARGQLRQLQDGARISRTDPNTGERIVLEEKDRPSETASAQKAVDTWCKK